MKAESKLPVALLSLRSGVFGEDRLLHRRRRGVLRDSDTLWSVPPLER